MMTNKHAHEPYQNLLRLMKARKIKIKQAAEYLEMKPDTFIAKAKGERDFFLQEAVKLAELLHVNVVDLFELPLEDLDDLLEAFEEYKQGFRNVQKYPQ